MVFCISGPLVHALNIYVFVLVAPYVSHILWAKNERVLLNCAPTSTKLHPPPPSSFQPPPSSLQHPQKYSNQSIERNWAISPNLDRKIQSSSFWLKIGSHGILEVLIPNPDLRFLKIQLQNPFLGKFGPKKTKLSVLSENWRIWYLKEADSYSDISFLNFQPKIHFRQICTKKVKFVHFAWKLAHIGISRMQILIRKLVFWI